MIDHGLEFDELVLCNLGQLRSQVPSIVVVVVPLVLGFWIGSETNLFVELLVWFGSSWILGMIWRADIGK